MCTTYLSSGAVRRPGGSALFCRFSYCFSSLFTAYLRRFLHAVRARCHTTTDACSVTAWDAFTPMQSSLKDTFCPFETCFSTKIQGKHKFPPQCSGVSCKDPCNAWVANRTARHMSRFGTGEERPRHANVAAGQHLRLSS